MRKMFNVFVIFSLFVTILLGSTKTTVFAEGMKQIDVKTKSKPITLVKKVKLLRYL